MLVARSRRRRTLSATSGWVMTIGSGTSATVRDAPGAGRGAPTVNCPGGTRPLPASRDRAKAETGCQPPRRGTLDYPGPRARVRRDPSLAWWRRVLPVIRAHRAAFIAAIGLSFAQPHLPDTRPQPAQRRHHHALWCTTASRCTTTSCVIIVVGLLAGVTGLVVAPVPLLHRLQRRGRPAIADLRAPDVAVVQLLRPGAVGPADQPGQQRHPQRPDVLDLRAAHPRAVLHRRAGVRLHAEHRPFRWRSSRWPSCRSCTSIGIKMRRVMFPISWVIQARLADVATIVDENVNGVRVVKSFAQEGRRSTGWPTRPSAWPGPTSRTPRSAGVVPVGPEPPPARAGPRAVLRGLDGHQRATSASARSWPSTPTC